MVHDQLHIRGGHQVSWLIDGCLYPTQIASNVGRNSIQGQRLPGGASAADTAAEYGDRTMGFFNV